MQMQKSASRRGFPVIGRSVRPLAMAICLWPAIAVAQPPDVVESDSYGNVAAGSYALYSVNPTNAQGNNNTGVGDHALYLNISGSHNTASGLNALYSNTTGSYNTAIGERALNVNTTGSDNTAAGYLSLNFNQTGNDNAAFGNRALFNNTTGSYNTASGRFALWQNTTGEINTASGANALYSNTTGKQNTALGAQALGTNTIGGNNVAVGYGALQDLTGGNSNNNIALGTGAGENVKSGSGNIYIGHRGINGAESNVTRIGTRQTKVFIAGIARTHMSGAAVVIRANGQLGVVASSARYKMDIRSLTDVSTKLARLRPVSFRYKTEPDATHYGLIAEEVDTVMPELVVRDDDNRPESVQYQELVPLLLQQWQAERELNARQSIELARQIALSELQQKRLDRLEAALDRQAAELRRAPGARLVTLDGGATPDQR